MLIVKFSKKLSIGVGWMDEKLNFYFSFLPGKTLTTLLELGLVRGNELALDLGCGEGRESIFLARLGIRVVAIDICKEFIDKLREYSEKYCLNITPICMDVLKYNYPENTYDLVLVTTLLNHLEREKIPIVINGVKRTLKSGGYVCVTVFTEKDPGSKIKTNEGPSIGISEWARYVKYYFKENELLRFFNNDFIILYYIERLELDIKHGAPHIHGVARLIAKKQ